MMYLRFLMPYSEARTWSSPRSSDSDVGSSVLNICCCRSGRSGRRRASGRDYRAKAALFGSLGVGQVGVEPLHGVLVVETHAGRHHADAALVVAGLCHVVEAGVVHDRVGRAVFLRERRRVERIDGNGRRRSHVVHEAQAVSDLVREDVAQGTAHDRVGDVHRADVGVGGCGLQEAPAVQSLTMSWYTITDAVMISPVGIVPRGAHGVLERQRGVADAGVFQVVGDRTRGPPPGGGSRDLNDVLEADLLEGVVPLFDTPRGRRVFHASGRFLSR